MTSPLISRPAYGQGRAAPVSEAKLPEGGPGGTGVPLDPGIPGTTTYAKPSTEGPREPRTDDENIYDVENADDLLKDRTRTDTNEDNANKNDGIGAWGKGEWDSSPKTKYPYRDDRPNAHNATAEFVVGCYLLKTARELVVAPTPMSRTAATVAEMTSRLDPATEERAATCSVSMKRADIANMRWLFMVNCGNGGKVVRVKAARSGNIVRFAKLDLTVSCSCPAWQWTGPEHHAKRDEYLDGKPRGTASTPVVKDPEGVHTVCKHVAAVLSFTKKWDVPKKG